MTALTINASAAAATTVAAAGKLFNATGGTLGTTTTKVAKTTLWVEIFGKGSTLGTAGVAAQGAASGNGWLWDVTTLEAQTIAAGTWTPTIKLTGSATGVTVTTVLRLYKRSSAGVFTLIGSVTGSSLALTASVQTVTMTPPSLSSMGFLTGDELYADLWCNITANTANSTTYTIAVSEATSGSVAGVVDWQVVTPGFAATPPTTIAVSDSATGADLFSLNPPMTDSASASDVASLGTIAPAPSDSASGSDTPSLATITLSLANDSASTTDTIDLSVLTPAIADSASGDDSGISVAQSSSSTPIAVSDSAIGAEAASLATVVPAPSEGSSGSEALAFAPVAAAASDSASGSGGATLATVAASANDTASGSDATPLAATLSTSDTSTASESAAIASTLSPVDTATTGETAQLAATLAPSETGTGSESAQLATVSLAASDSATPDDATSINKGSQAIPVAESGAGGEAAILTASAAFGDSASATEAPTSTAILGLAETAVAAETSGLSVITPSPGEAGVGGDAAQLSATLAPSDGGTGSASATLPALGIASSDSAASAEVFVLAVSAALTDAALVADAPTIENLSATHLNVLDMASAADLQSTALVLVDQAVGNAERLVAAPTIPFGGPGHGGGSIVLVGP